MFSGSVVVKPMVVLPFHIESASGGNTTATLDDNGLKFSGARLKVDGILGTTVTLPEFTLPADGNFTLPVNPPAMSIAGLSCASINFTLRRQNGVMSLNPIDANLSVAGFNQRLSGNVSSSGTVALTYTGSLTLGGFTAASGMLTLNNSGLTASGGFRIVAAGSTFNSGITFSGTVSSTGSFNLSGSGSLQLGDFRTDTFDLTLNSNGLSLGSGGTRNLNFGSLDVPFNTFRLGSSGVTAFNGSQSVNSGWLGFPGVWARLTGTGTVSSSANGTITASLSSPSFYWWFGGQPAASFYPDSGQRLDLPSGGISSDGSFFVGQSKGNQNGFSFKLW